MILNTDDFWECPTCHLQATTATGVLFAILRTRGRGELKDTKAAKHVSGWPLAKASPKKFYDVEPNSGFKTEEQLREFLDKEVHEARDEEP
jgi:hypothetical protein